jgi:hypothetical protein
MARPDPDKEAFSETVAELTGNIPDPRARGRARDGCLPGEPRALHPVVAGGHHSVRLRVPAARARTTCDVGDETGI